MPYLELCRSKFIWIFRESTAGKVYCKCPKISYTKVADKMAYTNRADPDQTVPEGEVWSGSTLFAIPLSSLRQNCIRREI